MLLKMKIINTYGCYPFFISNFATQNSELQCISKYIPEKNTRACSIVQSKIN